MSVDEGIVEDCMLKAFHCGKSGYAIREHDNKMRARGPRPYLDKNKQSANSPECPVGSKCKGRGKTGGLPARYNPFVENDKFLIPWLQISISEQKEEKVIFFVDFKAKI
jgi:hypothetical protein